MWVRIQEFRQYWIIDIKNSLTYCMSYYIWNLLSVWQTNTHTHCNVKYPFLIFSEILWSNLIYIVNNEYSHAIRPMWTEILAMRLCYETLLCDIRYNTMIIMGWIMWKIKRNTTNWYQYSCFFRTTI